jgi:hypothetical protein
MPIAEPRRSKATPARVHRLDLLWIVAVLSLIVGSTVFDAWQSPLGRPWMIGMTIAVPVAIALRRRLG